MNFGECETATTVSKIKLEERAAKAIFLNQPRETYTVVRVDGCVVQNEVAADYLVAKNTAAVVVELKGRDAEHGLSQVLASAKMVRDREPNLTVIAAMLVSNRMPRVNTFVQRAKDKYAAEMGAPLTLVSRNCEVLFDEVIRFGGRVR